MDKKKINRIIDFIREEMMTTGKHTWETRV